MARNTKTASKGTFQPDSDVHISFEDQQKINKFANLNAKLEELKDEYKLKENDIKSLEDAVEEVLLIDDDEKIPYLVGEVFIFQDSDATQKCLDQAKERIDTELKELKQNINGIKGQMSDLKSNLYGKFGSHINLEADEEE